MRSQLRIHFTAFCAAAYAVILTYYYHSYVLEPSLYLSIILTVDVLFGFPVYGLWYQRGIKHNEAYKLALSKAELRKHIAMSDHLCIRVPFRIRELSRPTNPIERKVANLED